MSESLQQFFDGNITGILDVFTSGVQNPFMIKRFNAALKAIEGIKDNLARFGLQVDYKKYFEQQLQIPLMSLQALSEIDKNEQRELLQNLFTRHLAGEYHDDSLYPAFIEAIKTLSALEISLLRSCYEHIKTLNSWGKDDCDYIPVPINEKDIKDCLNISTIALNASIDNLERCNLLHLGEGDCMYLTAFGISFLNACVLPIKII